jgi:hypothetical protein
VAYMVAEDPQELLYGYASISVLALRRRVGPLVVLGEGCERLMEERK